MSSLVPTARLWALLCLLALPTMAAGFLPVLWPFVLAVDAVLLGFAAADFLVARQTPLRVVRSLPGRLSVGVANKVELTVIFTGRRPVRLLLRDDVPDAFGFEPAQLALTLAPRSRALLAYKVTPHQRGRFSFGDLAVRVLGPFGLVWHQRSEKATEAISVFPDLRGASRLLLADATLDLVNLGLRQLRRDGRGSEFARLRDYAQGDSARDVDWKATARRTRPVTRVMESERSQSVILCLDVGRSMAAQVESLTKLDHAVNAALFLAFVALRNGDRVGLITFADGLKAFLPASAGRLQYRKIVEVLYGSKPQLTHVDYLALYRELGVRATRRSLVCLFTDILDEDQAATMVDPFRRLARKHVPLVLTVKDTGLTRLLATAPDGVEGGYQQAVASELLLEREVLKRKIAQGGVQMIDVEPQSLSLAAVNRYLEIKSRGTL